MCNMTKAEKYVCDDSLQEGGNITWCCLHTPHPPFWPVIGNIAMLHQPVSQSSWTTDAILAICCVFTLYPIMSKHFCHYFYLHFSVSSFIYLYPSGVVSKTCKENILRRLPVRPSVVVRFQEASVFTLCHPPRVCG